ncbi:hypothetical protein HPP92_004148 [Vanilla planifolia]|uniref:Uncharacterized protein n=1 Tax=Vanilla planifolia TaxID=51239 RepID=A0A835SDA2_VANPL|nr:hypothetical protein HPP92_004148 [Vanilla planifolia]
MNIPTRPLWFEGSCTFSRIANTVITLSSWTSYWRRSVACCRRRLPPKIRCWIVSDYYSDDPSGYHVELVSRMKKKFIAFSRIKKKLRSLLRSGFGIYGEEHDVGDEFQVIE